MPSVIPDVAEGTGEQLLYALPITWISGYIDSRRIPVECLSDQGLAYALAADPCLEFGLHDAESSENRIVVLSYSGNFLRSLSDIGM